ncbi:MAG: hypothetical protein WC906_01735 [Parcubacteria group bacterium]|jgi:hypothetical protein
MEETNKTNAPLNENKSEVPKKASIPMIAAIAIILILSGYIFYISFSNYAKEGQPDKTSQQVNQQATPENSSQDKNETDSGFDLFSEKYTSANSNDKTSEKESGQSNNGQINEYVGWKTYINSEIGYKLKYPADWKVEESSGYNEVIEQNVKSIVIYSPGEKYFLHWGIKEKNDPFSISGRTGIGAGDFVKDGKITILGKETDITKLVFEGKTLELFFPSTGSSQTKDEKHFFNASFSINNQSNSNIANVPELETAKKILKTIQIIPRKGTMCQSALTNQDKSAIEGYEAYYNKTHKYLIRIPNNWIQSSFVSLDERINPDDVITFLGSDEGERFQWKSKKFADIEIPGTWELYYSKEIKVSCEQATTKYFKRGNKIFLLTQFSHDGTKHSILYGFTNVGASLTSDIIEIYDSMLKSIEFED